MTSREAAWHEANQRYLSAELEWLAARLGLDEGVAAPLERLQSEGHALAVPAAIDRVTDAFGLSSFERDVLLLAAGIELDAGFAERMTRAGATRGAGVSVGYALAHLPDAHWSAIAASGPLRRWRLVDTSGGDSLTHATVRVDERVLHFLAGVSYLDPRLEGSVRQVAPPRELPASHQEVASRLALLMLDEQEDQRGTPVVHLAGPDRGAGRAIAAGACAAAGFTLHVVRAIDLPAVAADRSALSRLWEREAALEPGALIVDGGEGENEAAVDAFLETTGGWLIFAGARSPRIDREIVRCDYQVPTYVERVGAWERALGPAAARLNGGAGRIAVQFRLDADAQRDTATEIARLAAALPGADVEQRLWQLCRIRARGGLDRLADRIEPRAPWDQLVLPPEPLAALRTIVAEVRQQFRVHEEWGFARQGGRGLGVSALFVGPSGTGKTLAAEVMASELALDLYRIDLSQVISKYIGETEKNLRAVFDAAENGGAVLLFDEADALFGKRSEVKDSHDRYANIEISYLLQRMEAYRGLAILTSNLKDALDRAFLRRLRFVVQFPFPDAKQRTEIWQRIFPSETPTDGLDPVRLARLTVTGGNIRNIALSAAFLAADARQPVRMRHLLEAARAECAKIEKPLTHAETAGWV